MRGLVDGVVVAMTEGEPGRREAAGAVTDEVDDGGEFVGHGGYWSLGVAKYSRCEAGGRCGLRVGLAWRLVVGHGQAATGATQGGPTLLPLLPFGEKAGMRGGCSRQRDN